VFASIPSAFTQSLPDTVTIHFGGRQFPLNQLNRLKPPEYLNDAIIHFFNQYLIQSHHRSEQVFIFDTQLCPQLMSGNIGQALTTKTPVAYFEYDMLIIPMHIESHWFLMIVIINHETNTGTVVPLDSMSRGVDYSMYHAPIIRLLNTVRIQTHTHTHTVTH
jgi:Ulp1 family protease